MEAVEIIITEKQADIVKQKIKERYKGINSSLMEVIPATVQETMALEDRILNVAAYVRVSTEYDQQTSSFELQRNDFIERIQANPKWNFVGIYEDEGISGTELAHRKGMLQMLEDCRAGKIDYILAKSVTRFARNTADCLSIIEELKNMKPPVGVYFEADNIYTLDATGSLVLTIVAAVAEEESRIKSRIMNWSIEKRFSRGIFLTPKLLGYDRDENGKLMINPDEAETVKVIYALYLNGHSLKDIAYLLTQCGRKTKLGKKIWHPSTLRRLIGNERYCGDILARKTYTPNFKDHKSKKNEGNRNQYLQKGHHEPIITREFFQAANHLMASRIYSKPLPVLRVIDDGILRGYIPIYKDWGGFSAEDYQRASESAYKSFVAEQPGRTKFLTHNEVRFNMQGYQVIRSAYFTSMSEPVMTIRQNKLRFNTACLEKFQDVEYVEILLNTVKKAIVVRPCQANIHNAIRWGRLKEKHWLVSDISCKEFTNALFSIMEWDNNTKYRFRGHFFNRSDEKMLLFSLDEPEMTRYVERAIHIPISEENESSAENDDKKQIRILPPSWTESFGMPVTNMTNMSIFEQLQADKEWDSLRPAKEVAELNAFAAGDLDALMKDAEAIMERWKDNAE